MLVGVDLEADTEYVAQQKFELERRYLIGMIKAEKAPRLAPAIRAGKDLLIESREVHHASLIAIMHKESDVQIRTLESIVRRMCKHGFIFQTGDSGRGKYGKLLRPDTRRYSLGDWPEPGETS